MRTFLLFLAGIASLAFICLQHGESAGPLKPSEAHAQFKTPDDLRVDLVLAEPTVRQPVFLNFDERGRMWVVQYLQYPQPAGLTMLSRDSYWRAVYDKVPPPPPHHFKGADKITIHEDTNGDGVFDKHTTFIDGLNIVTAVARGRGGVWVLNPPYLLFYPDRNNDDVPDSDPEVHLEGFGLEDTHSVVNSLRWGPDGWLYAAQGSTVTGNVRRYGSTDPPLKSFGQHIWRYHPETRTYEIFAEGGGNAFGVEFDRFGRVFSGHNGGDTRGFHYVQGGYFLKGFDKHGPLSNPYAFGYFPNMAHDKVKRFTHNFVIADGLGLPPAYQGKLFGIAPLLNHVVISEVSRDGSTLKTRDVGFAMTTADTWFRPVDIKHGPDGALYVADWYDVQCAHTRHQEGIIDKDTGRIYRIRGLDAKPARPFDMNKMRSEALVVLLGHENLWQRQTALRVLADRKDAAVVPTLRQTIEKNHGQLALDALWALYVSGGLDEATALKTLDHANPYVRLWTVRLLCDAKSVSPAIAGKLTEMAQRESDVEARSQLACSARRLPTRECLAIVRLLLARNEDAADPHLPLLLWWALEANITADAEAVLALFDDPAVWELPLVKQHILERLMRRFAAPGTRKDLLICARLLKRSPGPEQTKALMVGFEAAYVGRPLTGLPDELAEALEGYSKISVVLGLRQGREEAVAEALRTLADARGDATRKLQYVQVFGEAPHKSALPALLKLASGSPDNALQAAALSSLRAYDDAAIADAVLTGYGNMTEDVRAAAHTLLSTRKEWATAWLKAVDSGRVAKPSFTPDAVQKLLRFNDAALADLVRKHYGDVQPRTSAELQKEIDRLYGLLQTGTGNPKAGRELFRQHCAKCHTLFKEGQDIGPDLSSYQRNDLNSLLLSTVNPSAEIREGYVGFFVETKAGQLYEGFLVDQDAQLVVLRDREGRRITLPRRDIHQMEAMKLSLMPEGILNGLSEQQLRDLFAYIRMSQPLIDR